MSPRDIGVTTSGPSRLGAGLGLGVRPHGRAAPVGQGRIRGDPLDLQGMGSGCQGGRSWCVAQGQSQEGWECPDPTRSGPRSRALSSRQRWVVPVGHRGWGTLGVAPTEPGGTQVFMGVAPASPEGWHQAEPDGNSSQSPMEMAAKPLRDSTQNTTGEHPDLRGPQNSMGMSPKAL